MNPTQLKIRRLRELGAALREARHAVHAERAALARALRMAVKARRVVDAARAKLARADEETGEYAFDLSAEALSTWHRDQVASLKHSERAAEKRLRALERAADATDPSGKARERRKAREVKAQKKRAKVERERQVLAERRALALVELEGLAKTDREKAALQCAKRNDLFLLGGYTSADGVSDAMREKLRKYVVILRKAEATQ